MREDIEITKIKRELVVYRQAVRSEGMPDLLKRINEFQVSTRDPVLVAVGIKKLKILVEAADAIICLAPLGI
jgi:hypothetical protein